MGKTVVVTGFGPFRDFKDKNPSWEAVKLIPGKNTTDIEFQIAEIPVTYVDVERNTKELWEKHKPELMVHVGVSALANLITIESQASRSGYLMPDCVGCKHPTGEACPANDGLDTICCKLDLEDICKEVNKLHPNRVACTSNNAGKYLCEYIYYKSLSVDNSRTIFIHVPNLSDKFTAEKVAEIILDIINACLRQLDYCNNYCDNFSSSSSSF